MKHSIKRFIRRNPRCLLILAIVAAIVAELVICGCQSPIASSRNASAAVDVRDSTNITINVWILNEPSGGASVLSGLDTNTVKAVAQGAAEGVTAVK
jgi:hypothetical protein